MQSQFVMAGLDPAIHDLFFFKEEKTWITGTSPVMTIVVEASRSSSRFNFQTATRVRSRAIARGVLWFCPFKGRGMERREAHLCIISLPASLARR